MFLGAGSSVPWCNLETIVSKAVLWRFVGTVVRELAINRLINCACQFRDNKNQHEGMLSNSFRPHYITLSLFRISQIVFTRLHMASGFLI